MTWIIIFVRRKPWKPCTLTSPRPLPSWWVRNLRTRSAWREDQLLLWRKGIFVCRKLNRFHRMFVLKHCRNIHNMCIDNLILGDKFTVHNNDATVEKHCAHSNTNYSFLPSTFLEMWSLYNGIATLMCIIFVYPSFFQHFI